MHSSFGFVVGGFKEGPCISCGGFSLGAAVVSGFLAERRDGIRTLAVLAWRGQRGGGDCRRLDANRCLPRAPGIGQGDLKRCGYEATQGADMETVVSHQGPQGEHPQHSPEAPERRQCFRGYGKQGQ